MSLTTLLNKPCVITRREYDLDVSDDYGDATFEESEVETVCELQQRQRSEDGDPGQLSKTSWLLVLPYGTEIGGADTVTVGGDDYEVVGEPWVTEQGSEDVWHVEATVVRTSGRGESVAG